MNEHDEALRKQTAFLGQPKGVGTLSFMQLCNSFANYAMSAVLRFTTYTQMHRKDLDSARQMQHS